MTGGPFPLAPGAARHRPAELFQNIDVAADRRQNRLARHRVTSLFEAGQIDNDSSPTWQHFLVERDVMVVGIDYLSVGSSKGGSRVHKTLLNGGVWIIVGLDLSQVSPGKYTLICLPLKVDQGDGAPARAILKPL